MYNVSGDYQKPFWTASGQATPLTPPGSTTSVPTPPPPEEKPTRVPVKPIVINVDELIQRKLDQPFTKLNAHESIALLMGCINRGELEAEKAVNQELIVFIGNTGAGKSTFANYLYGCKMVRKKPSDLGITGPDKIVIVKPDSPVKEIMPIGHSKKSMTFMPQIESDATQNVTYCDCPGFLDNRGFEINTANAVNIKNAFIKAKSVKVIILINYHSLRADRGRGLSDMIRICCNLFGSKENLIKYKNSIHLCVTQIPLAQVADEEEGDNTQSVDDLQKWIADTPLDDSFEMSTLKTLADRLFIYDPLDNPKLQYTGALARKEIFSKIKDLHPIETPQNIFKTVLTPEDEKGLISICEEIKNNIERGFQEKFLYAEDFESIAELFENLKKLEIIDHIQVTKLMAEARHLIVTQFRKLIHAFDMRCADSISNLNAESQKMLTDLVDGVRHFDHEVQQEINIQELQNRYQKYVAKHDAHLLVIKVQDLERKFNLHCQITDFLRAEEFLKEIKDLVIVFKQNYTQTGEPFSINIEDMEKAFFFSKSQHEQMVGKQRLMQEKIDSLHSQQEALKKAHNDQAAAPARPSGQGRQVFGTKRQKSMEIAQTLYDEFKSGLSCIVQVNSRKMEFENSRGESYPILRQYPRTQVYYISHPAGVFRVGPNGAWEAVQNRTGFIRKYKTAGS